MLKSKLSHLHLLDEQLERLQNSAVEISVITGHDLEQVEGAIVSLLTQRATDDPLWRCKACGAENSHQFANCVHCGASGRR